MHVPTVDTDTIGSRLWKRMCQENTKIDEDVLVGCGLLEDKVAVHAAARIAATRRSPSEQRKRSFKNRLWLLRDRSKTGVSDDSDKASLLDDRNDLNGPP